MVTTRLLILRLRTLLTWTRPLMNPYFPLLLPELLTDGTTRRASLSARARQGLSDAPAHPKPQVSSPPAAKPLPPRMGDGAAARQGPHS